ncbi:hypothetical protein [Algoriphagus hitonicola]|uniref:Uncharacterized protein n=1 Tax=Algoriphagus hitonicola TaxID=435880 RepID=A0A1I2QGW5_9BACT|nr:hypothetical protein [Algoriphagus hitonicola]SFG27642.1 hypothetical protein SAMN04487988_102276 [Algoriphagus hitonicola]
MNPKRQHSKLVQQRLMVVLALLLCFFVSSVEYTGFEDAVSTEQQNSPDTAETFLSVAVDAVVPFALEVTHTAFYLIYEIINFEPSSYVADIIEIFDYNQHVQILFERIISTKGP